jgi:hypothetical protein
MSKDKKRTQQKSYEKPKLEKLGNMAQVTRKSGGATDVAQPHQGKK